MSDFFSLLSLGDGRVYYFSPEQRITGVKMPNGGKCKFDSHASIAEFYGLDEDECNEWEYEPFGEKIVFDMQLTANDQEAVLEEIKKINFSLICGDIEGTREFIKHLGMMKFLDGHGDVPDGVKMFETRKEAYDAAWESSQDTEFDAISDSASEAAWYAAWDDAWDAAWDAVKDAVKDAAGIAVCDAVYDATLFIRLIYVCSGLSIDQKHIDYIKKRWSVWEAGYGVYCDADGALYCYKKNI